MQLLCTPTGSSADQASDALIGRLPGIAVFAAGLLAGALVVTLACYLASRGRRSRAAGSRAPAAGPLAGAALAGGGVPVGLTAPPPGVAPASRNAPARSSVPMPPSPRRAQRSVAADEPGRSCTVAPAPAERPRLRIGVLGSLTVNGQAGALVPAQSQLIVALALNQAGLSNRQLRGMLGADAAHPKPADSLRQLIARTRRALGTAADGREWIEHLGHGHYALHQDAWVDVREFERLTAADSGSEAALSAALSLVRGQPFTGCYYWWLGPEQVESVTARIVAAAETLATLRLAGRDPSAACQAARIGLAADSAAEQLWRVRMRAEHAAGNLAGVRGAWGRCLDVASEVAADGQPDSATFAVYSELLAR
jgi:hypothetical protein